MTSLVLTLALGTLTVSTSGCTRPATQLVVVVSSDLEVPATLATVRAHVRPVDAALAPTGSRTFALEGAGATQLPFSFGVVPPGGDPSRRVEIVVEGLEPMGAVVVSRRVRTGFLPEQTLRLPIFLASLCRDRICDAELTCDGGECVPLDVEPSSLAPVRPGAELLDAGPTGPDAGPTGPDAGRDAGPPVSCTPIPRQPWLALPGTLDGSDLAWRDGARGEWMVALGGSFGLAVHAIAEDVTGDREVLSLSGSGWRTRAVALVPLPSPDEALVVRESVPALAVRGTLVAEGGGSGDRVLLDSLSFLDVSTMGGSPVMLSDETPSLPDRPTGLYAIPTMGSASRIAPIDLGSTMYAYRGSLASRRDGSLLVGRAAVGACEVMPVSSAGVPGAFASFPVPGTCLAPAMVELADGRIAILTGSTELFVVLVVSADLTRVEGMRDLGTLARSGGAVVAAPDGSMRIFWTTPEGISTMALAADAALTPGETTVLGVPGIGWSGIARHGRATAITHVEAGTLMLTILCD